MYLGAQLEDVLTQLINTGSATSSIKREKLDTGVRTIPDFAKDATDRNRTAPLAFTGNKFEFRMVGSRDSVAASTIVLNTIVAEAFSEACDELEKAENFDLALHDLVKKYAAEHNRIVFSGNGYSQEWVEEAARRGLPNIKTMVDSIPHLVTEKTVNLFEKFGVFTRAELESRAEINYETYAKAINIEARAMIDIASKHIIPAVIKYITSLATSINQVKEACGGVGVEVQTELLEESSMLLAETRRALKVLTEKVEEVADMPHGREKAEFFLHEIVPVMSELRSPVDKLEMIVNKEMWPMPSYGDLLFEV